MMKMCCRTLSVFVIILIAGYQLDAQQLEFLNVNNVNAGIGIGGNLFSLSTDTAYDLFEVPKGSGKKAIANASLWLTALDHGGNLHGATQTWPYNGYDYFDGPVAAVYDSVYDSYYKRVFKITRQQVDRFHLLTFPATVGQIDSAILMWPGKGNPYVANVYDVNIASTLAPFVDLNNNGIYEPLNGEYPAFCGDEAIFFALNDVRGISVSSDCQSLGAEIRGLVYVFKDTLSSSLPFEKRAVNNTVFVQYEIENKSSIDYNNFYLAMFEDPDLGCYYNDRVGCDTNRNMAFVYNGTSPDPNCDNETGYGWTMVSEGAVMLNSSMSSFIWFTESVVGTPFAPGCADFRNYQTGYWADGIPFTEGGFGSGGTTTTKYIFPGDPNDSTAWSEVSISNMLQSGDRWMASSTGPVIFAIGDILHYDFAFTTSYDSTSTMYGIVDTLKRDADIVQAFYNNNILNCRSQLVAAGINEVNSEALNISIFPNPGNDQINIVAAENIQSLEMTDMEGRLVLQKTVAENRTTINTSIFARGVYMLKVKSEGRSVVKKVVLE